MSLQGGNYTNPPTLSGQTIINADYINTSLGSFFTGITSNIQQQINAISTTLSTTIPIFSIGTVTNTTSPSSVSISGTLPNQYFNFNLETPTFTIGGVNSLSSGTSPYVDISNNNGAYTLIFGLEQGQTGAQGPQGAQGAQGPQGDVSDSSISSAIGLSSILISGVGFATTALLMAALAADVTALETATAGLSADVLGLDGDVTSLQAKTLYISEGLGDLYGHAYTLMTSDLRINNGVSDVCTIEDQSGNIWSNGSVTCSSISSSGGISAGSLSAPTLTTTTINPTSTTLLIGTTGTNTITMGNATSNNNFYGVNNFNGNLVGDASNNIGNFNNISATNSTVTNLNPTSTTLNIATGTGTNSIFMGNATSNNNFYGVSNFDGNLVGISTNTIGNFNNVASTTLTTTQINPTSTNLSIGTSGTNTITIGNSSSTINIVGNINIDYGLYSDPFSMGASVSQYTGT